MRHGLVAVIFLVFAGCDASKQSTGAPSRSAEPPPSSDGCDASKIDALASQLQNAPPNEAGSIAVAGLLDACGESLPSSVRAYFEADADHHALSSSPPEDLAPMLEKACPEHAKLLPLLAQVPPEERARVMAEGCRLVRFDVGVPLDPPRHRFSLFPWAVHAELLEAGIDVAHARVVTRGLLAFDATVHNVVRPRLGLVLPEATNGVPVVEDWPQVELDLAGVHVDGETVAAITNEDHTFSNADMKGHRVVALQERLEAVWKAQRAAKEKAEAEDRFARYMHSDWGFPLVLVVDARVPFFTFIEVAYTAGRAQFDHFAFVVRSGPHEYAMLEWDPPRFGIDPFDRDEPRPLNLKVFLMEDGYRVSTDSRGPPSPDAKAIDPSKPQIPLGDSANPTTGSRLDAAALETHARKLAQANPEDHGVTLSAMNETPMGAFIDALSALRGRDCGANAEDGLKGCLFPLAVVEAGGLDDGPKRPPDAVPPPPRPRELDEPPPEEAREGFH